ncbi:4-alpha-glucanotransferase [Polymorphobacter multimanifer]|uniref:4-alpha-glucanotransferase n=1 Tax=Polymorphobacter multimanifer TaxID=1070431 RepID=A0A841L589_9SPHN|nr:4-alpha-glucanotransferase [Polymorphobacter multimanifer]MBB6226133.1 4-alpha-glucanotransferase [Polymorphobacter multimanifer]GGI71967.1 4-alpha-glucanotransferase [Polymorphobacter multimanifer]
MSMLHALATAAGLQIEWEDALGQAQRVSDRSLVAILAALGYKADSDTAIADSAARIAHDREIACNFVSAVVGEPLLLPAACGAAGPAELVLEDGSRQRVVVEAVGAGLRVPAIDTIGYHRLTIGTREISVAIAPPRCFTVEDAAGGRRLWGPAVQIAALRCDAGSAFGDFGTLADAARAFAARGADAIAISPVHALFPADARRFSPYAPSTRQFLNVLHADPALVGGETAAAGAGELIDWEQGIPARLHALRQAYDQRSDAVRAAAAAHAQQGGADLERHARFDALHAHFLQTIGAQGWRDWPVAYHDPDGNAVARFAAENGETIGFYRFLQWLAKRSLDAAQRAAIDGGMALGLIADLAVGMDPGGSHAWSRPDDLLTGLSIGAPPDLLGPDGQTWGITGFSPLALQRTGFAPFIATLRAALDHAGGIRIDHALGLRRLWVVPENAVSAEGAYLEMPMDDLFRLIALESHRARAVVIGEDLGTVPPGFRPAMDEKAMLGMRVLWFERDDAGGFQPADSYAHHAAAMTGTHDLPTVAGWWCGRDIEWQWQLGRTSRAIDQAADHAARDAERAALWQALVAAGVAHGAQPAPENAGPVVDAALAFIGRTPSVLAIVPMEDIIGAVEQPNLPGTIDEHPNWRRRLPGSTAELLENPVVAARLAAFDAERRR